MRTANASKPLTVLYVGDHDPSGLCMSEVDIPKRFARYGGSAEIRRVAIAKQDTASSAGLPWFPASAKKGDSRHKWFVNNYGEKCWELDAMNPVTLRNRVEAAIVDLLDRDAWNHMITVETAERESMRAFVTGYQSISGLGKKYSPTGST